MPKTRGATATALLAEIGLTDTAELWAMTTAAAGAAGTDRATAHLALAAAMALEAVDTGERHAAQKLAHLGQMHTTETANLAAGYAGNAQWLVQAAAQYADALARVQAGIEQFRAAAQPLAALAGLTALPDADAGGEQHPNDHLIG